MVSSILDYFIAEPVRFTSLLFGFFIIVGITLSSFKKHDDIANLMFLLGNIGFVWYNIDQQLLEHILVPVVACIASVSGYVSRYYSSRHSYFMSATIEAGVSND